MPRHLKNDKLSKLQSRKVPITFKNSKPVRVPVHSEQTVTKSSSHSTKAQKKVYGQSDFTSYIGHWTDINTIWGNYKGIVEDITSDGVTIKMAKEDFTQEMSPFLLPSGLDKDNHKIQLSGYSIPYWSKGPWCWCCFPFIVIIFVFPWFWW